MSNQKNPFHITKDLKGNILSKIRIRAVYPSEQNDKIDEKLNLVNEYCLENCINFRSREFDSFSKSDDRQYIFKLPAFHIYYNQDHIETVYTKNEMISSIENYISQTEEKIRLKEERNKEFKMNQQILLNMIVPDFSFLNYFSRKHKLVSQQYSKKEKNEINSFSI
jgi:hypothetical protein